MEVYSKIALDKEHTGRLIPIFHLLKVIGIILFLPMMFSLIQPIFKTKPKVIILIEGNL